MAKKQKLETYGARSMPLVRNPSMSDAEWDAATLEFDDTMRRMGRRITWQTRFKRCPQCGADNLRQRGLQFGALTGLCLPCSDKARDELLRSF